MMYSKDRDESEASTDQFTNIETGNSRSEFGGYVESRNRRHKRSYRDIHIGPDGVAGRVQLYRDSYLTFYAEIAGLARAQDRICGTNFTVMHAYTNTCRIETMAQRINLVVQSNNEIRYAQLPCAISVVDTKRIPEFVNLMHCDGRWQVLAAPGNASSAMISSTITIKDHGVDKRHGFDILPVDMTQNGLVIGEPESCRASGKDIYSQSCYSRVNHYGGCTELSINSAPDCKDPGGDVALYGWHQMRVAYRDDVNYGINPISCIVQFKSLDSSCSVIPWNAVTNLIPNNRSSADCRARGGDGWCISHAVGISRDSGGFLILHGKYLNGTRFISRIKMNEGGMSNEGTLTTVIDGVQSVIWSSLDSKGDLSDSKAESTTFDNNLLESLIENTQKTRTTSGAINTYPPTMGTPNTINTTQEALAHTSASPDTSTRIKTAVLKNQPRRSPTKPTDYNYHKNKEWIPEDDNDWPEFSRWHFADYNKTGFNPVKNITYEQNDNEKYPYNSRNSLENNSATQYLLVTASISAMAFCIGALMLFCLFRYCIQPCWRRMLRAISSKHTHPIPVVSSDSSSCDIEEVLCTSNAMNMKCSSSEEGKSDVLMDRKSTNLNQLPIENDAELDEYQHMIQEQMAPFLRTSHEDELHEIGVALREASATICVSHLIGGNYALKS